MERCLVGMQHVRAQSGRLTTSTPTAVQSTGMTLACSDRSETTSQSVGTVRSGEPDCVPARPDLVRGCGRRCCCLVGGPPAPHTVVLHRADSRGHIK